MFVRIRVRAVPRFPFVVVEEDLMGRSFGWGHKNRGPVSQQVWHDKDLSLIKGQERHAEIYSVLPFDNVSSYENNIYLEGSLWSMYEIRTEIIITFPSRTECNHYMKKELKLYTNHSIFNNEEKTISVPAQAI